MTETIKRNPSEISYCEISEFKELSLPLKNEQIRFITNKAKSTTDFIDIIIESYNVKSVVIANSAIDGKSLNRISEIIESGITVKVVINKSETSRKPKVIDDLLLLENTKLHSLHTKIILIEADDNYFVLEGSGNISTNAKIEQYSLSNCKESFIFHQNWIADIFNTEEIIEKPIDAEILIICVVESLKEIGVKGKTLKIVVDNISSKYDKKIRENI